MDRSDLDILAGRTRTLKAGSETITMKEPPGEFYLDTCARIIEALQVIGEKNPTLADKALSGGKFNVLDALKIRPVADLVFELLGMLVLDKGATWFRQNVGLRGLLACVNAAIEVVDLKEIRQLFFLLEGQLKEVWPSITETKEEEPSEESSSDSSTSSPNDTEQTP